MMSADMFVDFEYEIDPSGSSISEANGMSILLCTASSVDTDGSHPPGKSDAGARRRQVALSNLAGDLARQGNVTRAVELAEEPRDAAGAFDGPSNVIGLCDPRSSKSASNCDFRRRSSPGIIGVADHRTVVQLEHTRETRVRTGP